jgi:hypothetical protein
VVTLGNDRRASQARRAGYWGMAFVVLLLIGAGMASVPGGGDSSDQVRRFYDEHTGVILLSQVIELVATLPLLLFVLGLAGSRLVGTRRPALLTGGALILASLLTLIPPLLLVATHDRASSAQVHALAVLSDLADVLLFASIAAFAACGWLGRGPSWFRWLAMLVGISAAVRAAEILLGGQLLEVVAPLGFILLVIAFSVLLLRRDRTTSPSSPD